MVTEGLKAIEKLRQNLKDNTHLFDEKQLDIIENEIIDLNETLDALSRKYSMFDYWRDNCIKYGKILDILKQSPFVLDTINKNVYNPKYNQKYNFGTITDEELNIIKDWLFK